MGRTENLRNVFGRFPHPHGFKLGVADDEKPAAKRVRDCLGADGFAGTRWPGKIEGKSETAGMPFSKTPALEDQIVLGNLCQRSIEGPGGSREAG